MSIHTGHGLGCAGGAAGGVGLGGLQDRINEHHDKVVKHVQEHAGAVHDRVQNHVDDVRDAVINHTGGESFGTGGQPLHLIFPDWVPPVVSDQAVNLQAIPLPGGLIVSLVALVAVGCLALILASALVKTVVIKCSR